nr:MAG TPA: hypothetical protein [Bacteriophage sp.]
MFASFQQVAAGNRLNNCNRVLRCHGIFQRL